MKSKQIMPNANKFLSGFGLTKGFHLAGYILSEVSSTHVTIKRYQEYRYDITLIFTKLDNVSNVSYEQLYTQLLPIISEEHIIYGVSNPYRCVIDEPKDGDIYIHDDGSIEFQLTGHSYRKR